MGHLDLKLNIMRREMSLANKFNPEIQEILKAGRTNEEDNIPNKS